MLLEYVFKVKIIPTKRKEKKEAKRSISFILFILSQIHDPHKTDGIHRKHKETLAHKNQKHIYLAAVSDGSVLTSPFGLASACAVPDAGDLQFLVDRRRLPA